MGFVIPIALVIVCWPIAGVCFWKSTFFFHIYDDYVYDMNLYVKYGEKWSQFWKSDFIGSLLILIGVFLVLTPFYQYIILLIQYVDKKEEQMKMYIRQNYPVKFEEDARIYMRNMEQKFNQFNPFR